MITLAAALVLSGYRSWTLVLAGDIMLNQVSARQDPFIGVEPLLHKGDVTLANLEVPLTSSGTRTSRKSQAEIRARSQFVLRGSPEHFKWLKQSGITGVSLGNNHAMDYGEVGLKTVLRNLDEIGLKHSGAGLSIAPAEAVSVTTLKNGIRVGLISGLAFKGPGALSKCTPATTKLAGVNALNYGGKPNVPVIERWVTAARRRCDVLVVALHGGIEGKSFPTSYQVALAHAFIDAGADVVWGHHPHVLQGGEQYKNGVIFYSMGNLVSPTPAESGIVILKFEGNHCEGMLFAPIRSVGGRVVREVPPRSRARDQQFRRLCKQTASRLHGQQIF